MKKLLGLVCLLLVSGASLSAQTAVDAFISMNNVTPSAPGTALTTTIVSNGIVGGGLSGVSLTGSGMTVGAHQAPCTLDNSIAVGANNFVAAQATQAIALNTADSFSYTTIGITGSHAKTVWTGCIGPLPPSVQFGQVWDIVRIDGGSEFSILQLVNTTGSYCLRIEVSPNPTSSCITSVAGAYLRCSLLYDGSAATHLDKLACFQPYPPYAQVGATVSISQGVANVGQVRIGNAEIGTSNGNLYFESMTIDSSTAAFPGLAQGSVTTPWAGIITPTRAIDWSGAGVTGGIPVRNTICATLNSTATTTQINNAITACAAEGVVLLLPGNYTNVTTGITFGGHGHVTLRGSGADQTFLAPSNLTGCNLGDGCLVNMGSSDNSFSTSPSNTANWTAGYTVGTSVITLSAHTNLNVGDPIILDQLDDDQIGGDKGGIYVSQLNSTVGGSTSPGLAGPFSLEGNGTPQRSGRQQAFVVKVTACGTAVVGAACTSNSITIAPPLIQPNWSATKTPGAWWATSPMIGAGLEDLSIDATGVGGGTAVEFKNAIDSWVKGVRISNTSRAHVQVYMSTNITVDSTYQFLTQNTATESYGIDCFLGDNSLFVNNIFQAIAGPILEQGACVGNVEEANFAINDYYTKNHGWNQPANSMHAAATMFLLIENNILNITHWDNFHGTHHLDTEFRNYIFGKQPACYSGADGNPPAYASTTFGACTNNLTPVRLDSFARFMNVIGNVLGQGGGVYTSYQNGTTSIFDVGQGNVEGAVTVPDDPNVATTLMRWGNWDSFNAATRFQSSEVPSALSIAPQEFFGNPVPASQTLPASFYYSAKPSWWPTGKPWPIIGPDVSGGNITGIGGHAYTNPAEDCYLNTMHGPSDGTGAILSFNEATCYAGGGGGGSTSRPVAGGNLTIGGTAKIF